MNKQAPFAVEPFAAQGHQTGCRCAKCRQAGSSPGLAQEFLPLFAQGVPTRRNQPMFEVAPFAAFGTAPASLPGLGNEVVDAQVGEWGRRGQSGRWGMSSGWRPTPNLRRPSAWRRRRRARWPGWGFAVEPFGIETQSSEQVRWAQNALNQIMGLDLPVNGFLDVATRSALRSFQRAQGLPASGIVGPDTVEALRAAIGGQPAGVDGGEEMGEEVEIGPLTARLTWVRPARAKQGPQDPYPFTREGAAKKSGGGVYIVVNSDTGDILKVGKAMSFASRFGKDKTYRNRLSLKSGSPVEPDKLRFYLGQIKGVDPFTHVERALARLLINKGQSLPASRPVPPQPVQGAVDLTNILPSQLKPKFQPSGNLTLSKGTTWEVS